MYLKHVSNTNIASFVFDYKDGNAETFRAGWFGVTYFRIL